MAKLPGSEGCNWQHEVSWRQVSSGVPQGSIVGSTLFIICITDLDDGTECALSKFANNTKLRGVVDTPDAFAAILRDLNKMEKWADRSLADFNKGKCKSLHLGRNDSLYQHWQEPTGWKAALQKRPCGSW